MLGITDRCNKLLALRVTTNYIKRTGKQIGAKMKKTTKVVDGVSVSCFRDPSTIYGEWVVQTKNCNIRLNNKNWTKKEAMKYAAELENSRNKVA